MLIMKAPNTTLNPFAVTTTMLHWLSIRETGIDLAKKANPCELHQENKQERSRSNLNCGRVIKLTILGLTNRNDDETFSSRLI
jgi:hypothetical protein